MRLIYTKGNGKPMKYKETDGVLDEDQTHFRCTNPKYGNHHEWEEVIYIEEISKEPAQKTTKTIFEEPDYTRHKFLNDIGCEDYIGFDRNSDKYDVKRWNSFRSYERKYGVFVSNCWALDHAMLKFLYEHLVQYKKDASKIVNLEFHKFDYKGQEYTQIELINKMIDICEYILMDLDSVSKRSVAYKRLKNNPYYKEYGAEYWEVEFHHPEIEKEVWDIWAIIYPAMWW